MLGIGFDAAVHQLLVYHLAADRSQVVQRAILQVVRPGYLRDAGGHLHRLAAAAHGDKRAVLQQEVPPRITPACIQIFRVVLYVLDPHLHHRVDVGSVAPHQVVGVVGVDELVGADDVVGHVLLFAGDLPVLDELILELRDVAQQVVHHIDVRDPAVHRLDAQGFAGILQLIPCVCRLEKVVLPGEKEGAVQMPWLVWHGECQEGAVLRHRHDSAVFVDGFYELLVLVVQVDPDDDGVPVDPLAVVGALRDIHFVHGDLVGHLVAVAEIVLHDFLIQRTVGTQIGGLEIAVYEVLALPLGAEIRIVVVDIVGADAEGQRRAVRGHMVVAVGLCGVHLSDRDKPVKELDVLLLRCVHGRGRDRLQLHRLRHRYGLRYLGGIRRVFGVLRFGGLRRFLCDRGFLGVRRLRRLHRLLCAYGRLRRSGVLPFRPYAGGKQGRRHLQSQYQ